MKKYSFRLEGLLTLRKSQKSKALEAYGRATQRVRDCEKALKDTLKRLDDMNDLIREGRQKGFLVEEQRRHMGAIEEIKIHFYRVQKLLEEAKEEQRQRFNSYIEAKKNEDLLLKLKEKSLNLYQLELRKYEDQMAEEMSRRNALRGLTV